MDRKSTRGLMIIFVTIVLLALIPQKTIAMDNEDTTAEQLSEGLSETGYVLVEDGFVREITENEYYDIMSKQVEEDAQNQLFSAETATNDTEEGKISLDSYIPSYRYSFTPTSTSKVYLNKKYRVSPIFVSKDTDSISVTLSHTEERTVTYVEDVGINASTKGAIFSGIEARFSYSVSSSSSTEKSITGTLKPNKNYKYSAVVFQPRVHKVNGNISYYQVYQGQSTKLWTKSARAQYPCSVGSKNILDGIYSVAASDKKSGIPD